MKAKDTKRKTRTGAVRRIGALLLALTMTFGTWTPAFAEEPAPVMEEHVETPAEKTETPAKTEAAKPAEEAVDAPTKLDKTAPEEQKAPAPEETQADGLDISPEIVEDAVGESKVNPYMKPVNIGDTTVSGKIKTGKNRRKKQKKDVTVTVTVTRQAGEPEVKTVTIKPETTSQNWTVTLDSALAAGDQVSVTETYDGTPQSLGSETVQKKLRDEYADKLKMPEGEIWIEKTNANLVSPDEQAEALQMLKDANPDIAKDIESVKFSIDGVNHAYYEVTYTDGSTSDKVEAKGLKINTVTETSAAPTIEKVQVTDKQIIVTFAKEVPKGTKFYLVEEFRDEEDKGFCVDGNCTVDKSVYKELSQEVGVDGKTVTFPVTDDKVLELGKEFGVIVKEPHKFRSCAKSKPVITVPDKVAVRDPHKLTDADKKAIDKAIRDANTVNGVSKLPNLFQAKPYPAIIEFDKDGNARILDPNNVVVDWDSNYNPIFQKNDDGTYKVKDESKVYKIPAKDLVKNIAPKSPTIAVDTATGKVTVTPPAYKAEEGKVFDTDLVSYTLTYKDASEAKKTVTATRNVVGEKTTWSVSEGATINPTTGVITLKVDDIKVGGTLTAIAQDKGGLEGDTTPLESAPASTTLETAEVTYNANDGTGEMEGKKVNKGSKYTVLGNTFTPPENKEFDTWEVDGKKVAAGTEITVTEDTEIKAIWKEKNVTVKVTFDPNGGSGSMDPKTINKGGKVTVPNGSGSFKAPENKKFANKWEDDKGNKYDPGQTIENIQGDMTLKPVWEDKPAPGGDNDNPGTNPGGDNPGTNPNQPGDPNNPNKPNDPNAPGQSTDPKGPKGPNDPSAPWGKGNTDIDALLRRMKALRNDPAVRKILEGQKVIPRAGVGASTTAVESVLFPVDLLPAPKKREEE